MIVDGHVHLFRAASSAYPRETSRTFPAGRQALAQDLISAMDRAGVDRAVIIPLTDDDRYVRDCLALSTGRFAGIGFLTHPGVLSSDSVLRRTLASRIQGLRMFGLGEMSATSDPGDPEALLAFELFRTMADEGLKLSLYPPEADLAILGPLLAALPTLDVLLNHMGMCATSPGLDEQDDDLPAPPVPPPYLGAMLALAAHPNCHVMFSGQYAASNMPYPHADLRGIVDATYTTFGPSRIIWGSDYPMIVEQPGYSETLGLIDNLLPDLSEAARAQILGGNASRLFHFS